MTDRIDYAVFGLFHQNAAEYGVAVAAVAERLGVTEVATLDRRHFSGIRPTHVSAFELVPARLAIAVGRSVAAQGPSPRLAGPRSWTNSPVSIGRPET